MKKKKVGARLLEAASQAQRYMHGEHVEGIVVHEFDVQTKGNFKVINKKTNGIKNKVVQLERTK